MSLGLKKEHRQSARDSNRDHSKEGTAKSTALRMLTQKVFKFMVFQIVLW